MALTRDAPLVPSQNGIHDYLLQARSWTVSMVGRTTVRPSSQRTSPLSIGLRGSLALKEPKKRWTNSGAFPQKHLFLNLCGPRCPSW